MRKLMALCLMAVAVMGVFGSVHAQDDENFCESLSYIEYGDSVDSEITDEFAFDGYCFTAEEGDVVVITAEATSGDLDTILELYDPTGNEFFADNDDIEKNNTDSQIEFEIPEDGDYLILVTRLDREEGETTGEFTLSLEGTGDGGSKDPDKNGGGKVDASETITISCDTGETLYGGMQFAFIEIVPGYTYRVTVFPIDDFDPVVAVETFAGEGVCNDDESDTAGSLVSVPGEGSVRAARETAQVKFNLDQFGSPIITVGSFDGSGGRFAMVIEGLAITPSTELDGFIIRVPESEIENSFSVYMISRYTDLDPYLSVYEGEGLIDAFDDDGVFDPDFIDYENAFLAFECDDAGTTNCQEGVEALPGGGVEIANGNVYITGEFDAGLAVIPNSTDPLLYAFGSSESRTAGEYAIVIIGGVPSVDLD